MLPFLMIPAWDLRDRPGGGGSNRQCHRWHSLVVEGGEGGGRGIARRSRIRIRILHLHPRSLSAWADTDGGGTLASRKLSGHPLDASLETGKGDWQSDNSWWRRMVEMSQW